MFLINTLLCLPYPVGVLALSISASPPSPAPLLYLTRRSLSDMTGPCLMSSLYLLCAKDASGEMNAISPLSTPANVTLVITLMTPVYQVPALAWRELVGKMRILQEHHLHSCLCKTDLIIRKNVNWLVYMFYFNVKKEYVELVSLQCTYSS